MLLKPETVNAQLQNIMSVKNYPYIVRWHKESGSYPYYIEARVDEASNDNAPENAIYKRDDGTWATTDDIANLEIRKRWNLPWREQDERKVQCSQLRYELENFTREDDPKLIQALIDCAKAFKG